MRYHRRSFTVFGPLVVIVALLGACTVTVAQLREDPSSFGRHEVRLKGTVQQVFPIPLARVAIYLLEDDTGEIPVLSFRVPRRGEKLSIRCKLVYFSGQETVGRMRELEDSLIEFLVDNKIKDKKDAREFATRLLDVIKQLVGSREMSFFVVETVEGGNS